MSKTLKQRQLETGRTLALNGKPWRKLREVILARDPLCKCGCGRPSTDVDHIDNDPSNNDMDNLQGLAHECHSTKTGKRMFAAVCGKWVADVWSMGKDDGTLPKIASNRAARTALPSFDLMATA